MRKYLIFPMKIQHLSNVKCFEVGGAMQICILLAGSWIGVTTMQKYLLRNNLEISIHFMIVSLIKWPKETLEDVTGYCSTGFLLPLFNNNNK